MQQKSILLKPFDDLRIKEGAPAIERPPQEVMEQFPVLAAQTIESYKTVLNSILNSRFEKLKNKNYILAGATGPGIGGAIAFFLLHLLKDNGKITIISRDIKKTFPDYLAKELSKIAEELGYGDRFQHINDGISLEGRKYDRIIRSLKSNNIDRAVYINTVASASSGLLPGQDAIYVKDIDEQGLFQWKLSELDERSIEATKNIMGKMTIDFPDKLKEMGIDIQAHVFADWRGSLDKASRDPENIEYGRQGAYSTSLCLPKDYIQRYVSSNYGRKGIYIDAFLPIMRTPALNYIPGGLAMSRVYANLMKRKNVPFKTIAELAISLLDFLNSSFDREIYNPFPRFDSHEAQFESWFYEVVLRMNNNKSDEYYYENWI